jgi:hypothetical protein
MVVEEYLFIPIGWIFLDSKNGQSAVGGVKDYQSTA